MPDGILQEMAIEVHSQDWPERVDHKSGTGAEYIGDAIK